MMIVSLGRSSGGDSTEMRKNTKIKFIWLKNLYFVSFDDIFGSV